MQGSKEQALRRIRHTPQGNAAAANAAGGILMVNQGSYCSFSGHQTAPEASFSADMASLSITRFQIWAMLLAVGDSGNASMTLLP